MSDILVERFEDIVLPERGVCVQEVVAVTAGLADGGKPGSADPVAPVVKLQGLVSNG